MSLSLLLAKITAGIVLTFHALGGLAFPQPAPTVQLTPTFVAGRDSIVAITEAKLFPVAKDKVTKAPTGPSQQPPDLGLASQPGSATALSTSVQVLPPPLAAGTVNDMARAAVVNIICTTKNGGYFYPISGSGVIISESGVILTNAHVGQYFLLRDYVVPGNIDCVVRTGSPARAMYRAELLYLPPSWVADNANQIAAQESKGTGENDYAFLRIAAPLDPSTKLPATFTSIALTLDDPVRDQPVVLVGYPAGFLKGITIERELFVASAVSSIGDIFAFDDRGYPDLVSVGGTVLAQAGASGGAIVRQQDGALLAIVATASEGTKTSERDLRGITLEHINRSLNALGQGGIVQLVSGDLSAKALNFARTIAPSERQQLIDALKK